MRTPTLLAFLVLAGCQADKRLWIESYPPGAEVRLDREWVGTTPYSMKFIHYGTHRLALSLPGYKPYERDLEVPAPWYARFPIDIFTEVLFPIGWEDHKVARVTLEPTPDRIDATEFDRVRARAEVFRQAGDQVPKDLPPLSDEDLTPLVAVPR